MAQTLVRNPQHVGTLGEPPAASVLAGRIRHAIDDSLDRWDAGEQSSDNAKAVAELAVAHRALDVD